LNHGTLNRILEFDHVSRAYKKGVPVLNGVSFSMEPGEVAGLVGRNGTGKTTLLRIAMGMLVPHEGRVRVFGLSPTEDPVAVKRRIGYVAEDQVLPGGMSIADLAALHRSLFPKWDSAMERDLMDRFGLSPRDRIKKLSKGQKRQVALMLALCHRPELLILDEPAGGLDPAARREFLEASIHLLNREGSAILFSSHYMGDIERIGGRVLLLDEGRIRLDCELDRVREDLCVAMVPKAWMEVAALEKTPGCLRVRPVFEDWHAVFQGSPEAVREQLREPLGSREVPCVRVPLEELFVELVGGTRDAEAAWSGN
jgi:ABC-2 type transport system ATP-binding protein